MKKKRKQVLTVLALLLVAVAVVLISKQVNTNTGIIFSQLNNAITTSVAERTPAPAQATRPAATAPSVQALPTAAPNVTAAPVTGAPAAQQANPGTAEILTTVCNAVNSVKYAKNFSAVKDQEVKAEMLDCSVPFLVSIANNIIDRYIGTEQLHYTFIDGSCIGPKSGEPVTPTYVIPPSNREFTLDPAGVSSATAESKGGNMVYTVKIVAEHCTLENQRPYYHSMVMDYIDVSAIDLGPAKITQADINYDESIVTVTVNAAGQILVYEEYTSVYAVGAGSLGLSASGSMTGSLWERWTFTW